MIRSAATPHGSAPHRSARQGVAVSLPLSVALAFVSLVGLVGASGCPATTTSTGAEEASADSASAASQPPQAAGAGGSAAGLPRENSGEDAFPAILRYLSPEASAILVVRDLGDVDESALAAVFALPPAAAKLAAERAALDWVLEVRYPAAEPSATHVDPRFEPAYVAFRPPIGEGITLVRRFARAADGERETTRKAFVATLGADFESEVLGETEVLRPKGAFPWQLVLLDDHHVAFIPVRRLGEPVQPLIAASELSLSGIRGELAEAFVHEQDRRAMLAMGGPALHLDLPVAIARTRLQLDARAGGLEGIVGFELQEGDAAEVDSVREALDAGVLEDDGTPRGRALAALARDAAYADEGSVVEGRLELRAEDLASLRRDPAGGG